MASAKTPAPAVAKARAQYAGLRRHRAPDDPATLDAQQNLRLAKLADHVEKEVAKAPPLTDAQLQRISALLRTGGDAA